MRLNHRCVVVVLSGFLLTCAHEHAREPEGAKHKDYVADEPTAGFSRPDGELVSGSAGGVAAEAEEAGVYDHSERELSRC